MKSPTSAAVDIEAARSALEGALILNGTPSYLALMTAVNNALAPVLADPNTPVQQPKADEIGAAMRALAAELDQNGETDLVELEEALHANVSQACVDYAPDVDWNQAAGVTQPDNPTESGDKHAPEPSIGDA